MSQPASNPATDDDLHDVDVFPEDGPEGWLSLLRIGLTFTGTGAALFAICWAIA